MSLFVSACLGALIGLIRQWSEQQERAGAEEGRGDDFAGLRTFTLLSVLGYGSGVLAGSMAAAVLPVALGAVGLYLAAVQFRSGGEGPQGETTFVASLLTFLVGGLVCCDRTELAIPLAAGTMVMLGVKQAVHAWTRRFTAQDIRAALVFAAVSGVALPVFPDQGYGPFEAFNPRSVWLMVVLISGLGFVGYILMRLLGTRAGIMMTGLVGGLASSTATTLAMSRRSRETPALGGACALAVALACTVMVGRVALLLGAVSPALAARCWPGLLAMAVPGIGSALFMVMRRSRGAGDVETPVLANPLNLAMAIRFALLYAAVIFLVKAATHLRIEGGLLVVSFISGLTDMDAIALSVANQATAGGVAMTLAAQAVLVGAVANTVMKGSFAVALGGPGYRRVIVLVLGLTAVAGVGGIFLVR